MGDGTKICFWRDLWWGDQPLCLQFLRLFRVITTKNLFVSFVFGSDSPPWNIFFHRNLIDLEIKDLERLMIYFSSVHLSPFVPDAKAWTPSSSGVFSVKSFFLALTNI